MTLVLTPVWAEQQNAGSSSASPPTTLTIKAQSTDLVPLLVGEKHIAAHYLPQTLGQFRGSIVLMHDVGSQLDAKLLSIIRHYLPAHGWQTLTIPLNNAEFTDLVPKTPDLAGSTAVETSPNASEASSSDLEGDAEQTIDSSPLKDEANIESTSPGNIDRAIAALAWLQQNNPSNLILIAHGQSAASALKTIHASPHKASAVVLIAPPLEIDMDLLTKAKLPIMTVTGGRLDSEYQQVMSQRRIAIRQANGYVFDQRHIESAGVDFRGVEDSVARLIHGWLHRQLIQKGQR
ncbi:Protein of unknown function (DUF3530) [Methylophaga frappieri]|uniref:DUF3530 family protein n=1 Tax=Methylophaga frappieri (strain ATCC BAA-2434 / DSM 25690 / JAM7) TaxID=754477 RepID=I1YEP7_METFJ|nr:DUF3530 family protein [Methylophaga frappieri]AFJ01390.1 Protein of unknown function (DUF3530) [Methylophaga frappieri]